MNAQEMWNCFSAEKDVQADYEAWAFGDDPDGLAALVANGIKTATSSLHLWYELENEELPKEGEYSVILDSKDKAICIIKNLSVHIVPFCDVTEYQAYCEGEGDRSLSHWKKVHEDFFSEELKSIGKHFDESMKVVCEEFSKVYP